VTERVSTGEWDRARVERLSRAIGEELRTRTYAQAPVDEVDVGEWRKAARLAGRRVGLRVRTGSTRCRSPARAAGRGRVTKAAQA